MYLTNNSREDILFMKLRKDTLYRAIQNGDLARLQVLLQSGVENIYTGTHVSDCHCNIAIL